MRWKSWLKSVLPAALVQQEERRRELARWKISSDLIEALGGAEKAHRIIRECNFILWPEQLRVAPFEWTLVDVGANRGAFVANARRLVHPTRTVIFEPIPELATAIDCQLGPDPTVRVRNVAVGERPGEILINQTTDSVFSSVLTPKSNLNRHYGHQPEVARTITAKMVTLDDELADEPRIGVLKIDVQGFEPQVLLGAQNILRRTEAVLIEINYVSHYDGEGTFDTNHRLLTAAGFRLSGVSCPTMAAGSIPLWADAIYTRDLGGHT